MWLGATSFQIVGMQPLTNLLPQIMCSASTLSLTQAWASTHSARHHHYSLCSASWIYSVCYLSKHAQPSSLVEYQNPAHDMPSMSLLCIDSTLWQVQ